ncbi:hypothetical protein IMCC3317_34290 [Kordia antarctica]|uniref:Uncharacterized protein n=1 Tax=Kordia antarctica TaxID=1218801 RepID=A0A7L4ZN57_9FLAO|nr:hypothetical protein [Kordia antarctica]QHI38045.1 hypothetical protein IMCC3317_34290 [Kordia antarctica]
MEQTKQHFSNLQLYLEYCFSKEQNVTPEMVKQAKAEYRKIYQSRYRKRYREQYVQVTFRVDKSVHDMFIEIAKQKNIKVTALLKQRAIQQQQASNDVGAIRESLLSLLDNIEEAIHEDETIQLTEVLQQLITIYELLP